MRVGDLKDFGEGGDNGAFIWPIYPDTIWLKLSPTNGEDASQIMAYNTKQHNISTIGVDTEVDACVNFELTCFKPGGGAFFLSA